MLDSVVKIIANESLIFRRARGFAPATLVLPKGFENAPPILAFGGELKNNRFAFCAMAKRLFRNTSATLKMRRRLTIIGII